MYFFYDLDLVGAAGNIESRLTPSPAPDPNLLGFAAVQALSASIDRYVNGDKKYVDFSQRGFDMHQKLETIVTKLSSKGSIPRGSSFLRRGSEHEALWEVEADRIRAMCLAMSHTEFPVNATLLTGLIANGQFSDHTVLFVDGFKDGKFFAHLLDGLIFNYLITREYKDTLPSREISVDFDHLPSAREAMPHIISWLEAKIDTGRLIIGKLPLDDEPDPVMAALILPNPSTTPEAS